MSEAATAVPTVGSQNGDGASIFDKTICLVLTVGSIGTTRKAKGAAQLVAAEAVQANRDFVTLNKKLFQSPKFKAIKSLDGEFRTEIDKLALPSLLKSGTKAIPIPFVEKVDDMVIEYKAKRAGLVADLKAEWPTIVAQAAEELGPQLFDPRNYPSAERLDSLFYVEHRWIDYGTPARLKAIKADIFRREQEKAEAEVQNAKEQAINDIRGRALGLVSHIVERLTPSEDGKRKIFRDTMLGNVKEFLDIFPVLNTAAGDSELAPIVAKARLVLDGVDPKLLRDDELVRQKVQQEFSQIETLLDGMVTEQTRRIVVEDDDEGAA